MYAPLDSAGPKPFNDWFTPDTTQNHLLGLVVKAVDPYWGYGEFMYIKSNDALLKGSLVMFNSTYQGVLLPSTAGQGFPFGVAMNAMATGVYGWIQIAGRCVYKTNATVAADTAIAVAAAGIAGTLANGKQLVNCRNVVAATGTTTVTAVTTNGNGVLTTGGYDGFFLGMALSGTGIPASTVVAKLDSDGRTIYTGSAIGTLGDKNSTASGSITLTGTYTGFGSGMIMYPFAQGQVA
jgi:hypothetical protein